MARGYRRGPSGGGSCTEPVPGGPRGRCYGRAQMTAGRVNPWLVLVLVCLAQFMVVLDATIVNVALPSIQADLGLLRVEPAVDRQRVRAPVRRLPAARWPRRRPDRPQARVPRGSRPLHVRVAPLRRSRPARRCRSLARGAAGPGRRARLARRALDRDDDVQGGCGADEGPRRLGGDRGRWRRGRPRAGRLARRGAVPGRGSSSSTCRWGSSPSSCPCASCRSRRTSTPTRASTWRAPPTVTGGPDRPRLRDRPLLRVRLGIGGGARVHRALRGAARRGSC